MAYELETASSDRYKLLKEFAKKNRDNPTLAESFLWQNIKSKALGVKFQRQHIVYDYIADFICIEKKLIIEVDGGYHFTTKQQIEDEIRSKALSSKGFTILRFTNEEVLFNIDFVIHIIKQTII